MDILIIGGTRFLGKKIIEILIKENEYRLHILSRRADIFKNKGCEIYNSDRKEGLEKINNNFDLIIDFIAYNEADIKEVFERMTPAFYILISTAWVVKLKSKAGIDQFVEEIDFRLTGKMPDITKNYLLNKVNAENYLRTHVPDDKFSIIRLPILSGKNDHTKRLDFYVSRVIDEYPIILINGGSNQFQIGFIDEIASLIIHYIKFLGLFRNPIVNAIPATSISIKDLVTQISEIKGVEKKMISVSEEELISGLPEYLEEEPFWREVEIPIGTQNLFNKFKVNEKPYCTNLQNMVPEKGGGIHPGISKFRMNEINFLSKKLLV